jgi:uncharacterized protein (TIGR03086 family)
VDQLTAHQRAHEVFAEVLANIQPSQLSAASPCPDWDVEGVIRHVINGNQRVQLLAGREPIALPDDLMAAEAVSSRGAHEVFAAPDGLSRTFDLPIGQLPGSGFIRLRTIDAVVHAWDIAKATGQPTDLDPELSTGLLDAAKQQMTPALRGEGRPFGAEQTCPDSRCAADHLAAFLGRAVD